MAHDPKILRAALEAAAPLDLELTFRSMFGGIMGYANGLPFASCSDVGLALKLARADHAELAALPGAKPLQYEPHSPPSKSYVVVPEEMLADPAALGQWIARAAAGLKPGKAKKQAPARR